VASATPLLLLCGFFATLKQGVSGMTSTINIAETTLPDLLLRIEAGDTVILTRGDGQVPVARIEALSPPPPASNRFGFWKHLNLPPIPDSAFFDPLPEDELRLWEGEKE
jgi:antitoxin (DNA-binding transcriptional repressor) of toxin-antitoxin stability system